MQEKVSIPYRDDKNRKRIRIERTGIKTFQSLIGTIKTGKAMVEKARDMIGFNPL